jgi:hypothetical protein
MHRSLASFLAAASSIVLFSAAGARADTVLTATLTNGQEGNISPTTGAGVPRTSSGTATFVLNDARTAMTFTATVTGIDFTGSQSADTNDNLTNAHIHASSDPNFTPPQTGGVVWGFFGAPFNDNNPNDQVVTPFATGVGGTVSGKWDLNEGNNTNLAAQIPNILAGRSYINFHTVQFGGGEIRGAIVPEPAAAASLMGGLALLGSRLARRRGGRR